MTDKRQISQILQHFLKILHFGSELSGKRKNAEISLISVILNNLMHFRSFFMLLI